MKRSLIRRLDLGVMQVFSATRAFADSQFQILEIGLVTSETLPGT